MAHASVDMYLAHDELQKRFLLAFLKSRLFLKIVQFASTALTAACTIWTDSVESSAAKAACYAAPIVAVIASGLNFFDTGTMAPNTVVPQTFPLSAMQGVRVHGNMRGLVRRDIHDKYGEPEYYLSHFTNGQHGNHTTVTAILPAAGGWKILSTVHLTNEHLHPDDLERWHMARDCTADAAVVDDNYGDGDVSECSPALKHKFISNIAYNAQDPTNLKYNAQNFDGYHASSDDLVDYANDVANMMGEQNANYICSCAETDAQKASFIQSVIYSTQASVDWTDDQCVYPAYKNPVQTCEAAGYSQ